MIFTLKKSKILFILSTIFFHFPSKKDIFIVETTKYDASYFDSKH